MKEYDEFDRNLMYYKDKSKKFIYKHDRRVARFGTPRIFHLTINHLKNMLRDRIQLIFIIGFPIMFMFLFSLQAESVSHISYDIIIINNDILGVSNPESEANSNTSLSYFFINLLESDQFQGIVNIVSVNNYTLEESLQYINNDIYDGLLVIEQFFTEKLLYESSGISGNPEINITTINDEIAYNLITKVTTEIVNSMSLQLYGGEFPNLKIDNDLNQIFNFFDLFFPSILLASILVCISQVATHFTGEKESGTIIRLSTTAASRSQILISGALAQFLITSFQIMIMLTLGTILGANIHPNTNWFLVIIILSLVTFSALGLGLLLASFLKTYNQAGLFSWFIILPLLFLGGLFSYGVEFEYSFIFPTYWAAHALRMVMLYGIDSWDVIGFDIIYLVAFTIILTPIGLLLFQHKTAILT